MGTYEQLEFKTDSTYYVDGYLEGTWIQSGSTVAATIDGDEKIVYTAKGSSLVVTESFSERGMTMKTVVKYSNLSFNQNGRK